MWLTIGLLVGSASVIAMMFWCGVRFGRLTQSVDRSILSTQALSASTHSLSRSLEDTRCGECPYRRPSEVTMVNKPRTPGIRPWSPGADELEYIPPTEHSA